METKVYISSLEKFIGDKLIGKCINLPLPEKLLEKEIEEVLLDNQIYFITDYEGSVQIEKFADLYELNKFLKRLQRFNEYNQQKICFLLNVIGCYPEEAMKQYKAVDFYPGMTLKDMALREIKESDIVVQTANSKKFIDFEKLINDLIFDGFYETENGTFWYF